MSLVDARDGGQVLPGWKFHDDTPIRPGAESARWSGSAPPPAIGERVFVRLNNMGPAEVRGYFERAGFLGLVVKLDSPPDWYSAQSHASPYAHVYGAEIRAL